VVGRHTKESRYGHLEGALARLSWNNGAYLCDSKMSNDSMASDGLRSEVRWVKNIVAGGGVTKRACLPPRPSQYEI
jgi:hypothetical protein